MKNKFKYSALIEERSKQPHPLHCDCYIMHAMGVCSCDPLVGSDNCSYAPCQKITEKDFINWLEADNEIEFDINDYQKLAMRTNDGLCNRRLIDTIANDTFPPDSTINIGELLNGALGLTGEAGEVGDIIKKHIFHGHDLDREALYKELGDVCWYLALLCESLNISIRDVVKMNIDKLMKRYPKGFSESASINRED